MDVLQVRNSGDGSPARFTYTPHVLCGELCRGNCFVVDLLRPSSPVKYTLTHTLLRPTGVRKVSKLHIVSTASSQHDLIPARHRTSTNSMCVFSSSTLFCSFPFLRSQAWWWPMGAARTRRDAPPCILGRAMFIEGRSGGPDQAEPAAPAMYTVDLHLHGIHARRRQRYSPAVR